MIEYKVVSINLSTLLADEVNKLLADGWELYGNLVMADGNYAQALIRKKEAEGPAEFLSSGQKQDWTMY